MDFPSYPKVLRLGHRFTDGILDGDVTVQEKVDGSQFNWHWDTNGKLHAKSKGMWQLGGPEDRQQPEKMFVPAVEYLKEVELPTLGGLYFRGETVTKLRHNSLTYSRIPNGFLVLFDVVDAGWHTYDINVWAGDLGIDMAPTFYRGPGVDFTSADEEWLKRESVLGGRIEGIVIKNYSKMDLEGKPMMAKIVSEEFIELHSRTWKSDNPDKGDVVQLLVAALNTEARFLKAIQHLAERGELVNAEQDIGKLMVEVKRDVMDEEVAWITERLVKAFMPQITRGIGRGLPDFYKALLTRSTVAS